MSVRLGYLGPMGTYSEQAAVTYAPDALHVPFSSIPSVVRAVSARQVDEAIVPIENSMEGMVTFTTDLLIYESASMIKSEVVVPIHHCLLADPNARIEDVRIVYSHPQAIAQCRGYLSRRMPNAEHVASLSTASAVEDMRNSRHPSVAISSYRAAELFGSYIAEANIEDVPNNRTRFIVLSSEDGERTGYDRTSICFDFSEDRPGTLYEMLGELASRRINMIKIESRPHRISLGRYIFLMDMEGHREDVAVRDALAGVRSRTSMFRMLGSYPRAKLDDIV